MKEHFNQLTPAQAERLAMLSEEAGEIVQIVGKILRHGYASCHPNGGPTNRNSLERELADLLSVCMAMGDAEDIASDYRTHRAAERAWKKKLQYSHHQIDNH